MVLRSRERSADVGVPGREDNVDEDSREAMMRYCGVVRAITF